MQKSLPIGVISGPKWSEKRLFQQDFFLERNESEGLLLITLDDSKRPEAIFGLYHVESQNRPFGGFASPSNVSHWTDGQWPDANCNWGGHLEGGYLPISANSDPDFILRPAGGPNNISPK